MRPSRAVRTLDPDPDLGHARGPCTDGSPFTPVAPASEASPPAAPFAVAVSVETVFAGASVVSRLLPAAHEERRARDAPRLLMAGAGLIAVAFAIFVAVTVKVKVGAERTALDEVGATGLGRPKVIAPAARPGARALDGLFLAALLGGGLLVCTGLHRRAPERHTGRRSFTIGSSGQADAPVDASFVSGPAHELVTPDGGDYLVHPTPAMSGLVEAAGQTYTLAELSSGPRGVFRLPPGARAQIACGRTLFVVRSFSRPAPIPMPPRGPDAAELPYAIGAVVALGLFVLMIFTVPPDPRSLSFDLLGGSSRLISFHTVPPADPGTIDPGPRRWQQENAPQSGPQRPDGRSGSMGDEQALASHRRGDRLGAPTGRRDTPGIGPESPEYARTAGILGILTSTRNSDVLSVWRGRSGFGDATGEDAVLGNLTGTQVGSAFGIGGLAGVGTGSGGGGTGEGAIGFGYLHTIGPRAGSASGSGYDGGVGRLGGRRQTVAPDVIPGTADVRGSLDREIIRRIIHRHLNEVRFCYEQQLGRQPHLGGRVGVQFTISGRGQVITSVLQSSTLSNRAVETCTVNAVRRWEFPQPRGGGLVMVSYPFLFTPPP